MLPNGGSSSQETSECQYSPAMAFGIGVGMDGQNLGMSLRTGRVRVNVQVAKIAAERLVGFHVERLIAKEEDLMLRPRLVQLLDLAVAERLGERQARDLRANTRRDRHDIDGFVAHRATVPLPSALSRRLSPITAGCNTCRESARYVVT
jgi:hypothetical protein